MTHKRLQSDRIFDMIRDPYLHKHETDLDLRDACVRIDEQLRQMEQQVADTDSDQEIQTAIWDIQARLIDICDLLDKDEAVRMGEHQ